MTESAESAGPTELKERSSTSLTFHDGWSYAPAPESTEPIHLRDRYGLFIGGDFQPALSGRTFASINPATEETVSEVAEAGPEDVDRAVASARRAYDEVWSKLPASERGKYLFRIARILQERSRELAIVESMDGGKPIRESRDIDVPLAAAHFFYHAGWADKLDYRFASCSTWPRWR